MESLVVPLLIAAAILFYALRRPGRPGRGRHAELQTQKEPFPYYARRSLASPAELRFYEALELAIGKELRVCPKVRVADVLNCEDDTWSAGYGPLISSKHFDFVLANPKTLAIELCLELDDASHQHPDRRARDEFLDRATADAGVHLVRVRARASYDVAELRTKLLEILEETRAT